MKNIKLRTLGLVAVVVMLSGCFNPFDSSDVTPDGDEASGISQPTGVEPSDVVNDVQRINEEFAFETYVSVDVNVNVEVISGSVISPASENDTIAVSIADTDGTVLYQGLVGTEGAVEGVFGVTTAQQSVTLTVEGPGLETRTVVIEDPAALQSITRTMQVVRLGGISASIAGTVDTDGDGVPDVYDAYPNDRTIAFEVSFPGGQADTFTVAYEDNFPNLGDGDYNDFVVEYSIDTLAARDGRLVTLSGTATARAKVAGYDHEFGLMFRIPGFSGTLVSQLEGESEVSIAVGEEIRVPLFRSTAEATAGGALATATFSIIWNQASSTATTADLPPAPFDPYLYIKNTDYDVHLIGQSPLPGSRVAANEDYRDDAGFPRALLVPSSFKPPQERTSILDAYPAFGAWVEAEGGPDADGNLTSDWYLTANPDLVMTITP